MRGMWNVVDGVLLVFLAIVAVATPLLDCQIFLPEKLFPSFAVDFKNWYSRSGDYLYMEKPHYFRGHVLQELIYQWPLALACMYGIIARKSWVHTTCLIYGASSFASLACVVAELQLSNRVSNMVLMFYWPFLGLMALTVLRALSCRHLHGSTRADAFGLTAERTDE